MTILFYSPFDNRSRDTESLMIAFSQKGNHVISLSQAQGKFIHPFLQTRGIKTYSYLVKSTNSLIFNMQHIAHLIFFCYKHKVSVVYAHLESASFVATIANFFIRSKVFICRHHIDEAALQGFDKSILYRITYKLASKIIVVSDRAVSYMITSEGINRERIAKINLAYDFELYSKPNNDFVQELRVKYKADILLVSVGRLTKYKRFNLSIDVLKELISRGLNCKLLILGVGGERESLSALADAYKLSDRVALVGFVNNTIDYLAASDYLLHPSILESSCVVVKEAGLVSKPVFVCKDVGDFEDYIEHGQNGFLVGKDTVTFVKETSDLIFSNQNSTESLKRMGEMLNKSVRINFSIENVFRDHLKLVSL